MSAVDRPLRRDAERNRRLVLDAARELFAARGLTVTLDDVAHHAGLGVGTVYRRFGSREELIEALFEERVGVIVALAEEGLACDDPWLGLTGFLERTLELQASDRGLKELLLGTSEGRDHVARIKAQMRPLATELVRRARAAGALRADFAPQDLPLLQMMLGAVVDAAGAVRPELWRRYLALILDGMRADETRRGDLPVRAVSFEELEGVMRAWRPPGRPRSATPET